MIGIKPMTNSQLGFFICYIFGTCILRHMPSQLSLSMKSDGLRSIEAEYENSPYWDSLWPVHYSTISKGEDKSFSHIIWENFNTKGTTTSFEIKLEFTMRIDVTRCEGPLGYPLSLKVGGVEPIRGRDSNCSPFSCHTR